MDEVRDRGITQILLLLLGNATSLCHPLLMVTVPRWGGRDEHLPHLDCSFSFIFSQTGHEGELVSRCWTVNYWCQDISVCSLQLPLLHERDLFWEGASPVSGKSWHFHGSFLHEHQSNIPDHQWRKIIKLQFYTLYWIFSVLLYLHLIMSVFSYPSLGLGELSRLQESQGIYRPDSPGRFSHHRSPRVPLLTFECWVFAWFLYGVQDPFKVQPRDFSLLPLSLFLSLFLEVSFLSYPCSTTGFVCYQKNLFVSLIQNFFITLFLYTIIFALSLRLPKLQVFFFFWLNWYLQLKFIHAACLLLHQDASIVLITSFVSLPSFRQHEPYPSGALHAQSDSVQKGIWCAIISVIQKS